MSIPMFSHGPFAHTRSCKEFIFAGNSFGFSRGRVVSSSVRHVSASGCLEWRFQKDPFDSFPKAEQSWQGRLTTYVVSPSEEIVQEISWQRTFRKCNVIPLPNVSVCAKLASPSAIRLMTRKTAIACRATVHSQPFSMDEEAPIARSPSYLLQTDREESARLASAVGLIMGTAVGPGILGLPAATLQAGLIPSSATIVAAWAYVMASVLLVAELSYAVMAEQGGEEVSFTGLAVCTLGPMAGRVVAVIYALLNYALLVACVAGLHSILACWLPWHPVVVCLLSPGVVVSMLAFTPFKAVDLLNRGLCGLMLVAITSLVGIGIYVGQDKWAGPMDYGTWSLTAVLPAVPVIVLTLGFHVITPLVCKVVGGRPKDAHKAILCGGAVPLLMVLAWNAVILCLAPVGPATTSLDPIKLLLSMSSMAAPAVQAFAFAALGTTLIGYALSFPKQLIDTVGLFKESPKATECKEASPQKEEQGRRMAALVMAMAPPVAVAMTSPTAFASALDFAGVYANCFLFGVLPPIMAWAYRYHRPQTAQANHARLVPGGRFLLTSLLLIAVFLGLKPPSS